MSLASVRRKARAASERARPAGADGLVPARLLLDAALASVRIDVLDIPCDDAVLCGGLAAADRQMDTIWVSLSLSDQDRSLALAHELGHIHLHDGYETIRHVTLDTGRSDGQGSDYVAYSPAALREVEAQAFAAEFLAPGDRLLAAFVAGASHTELAALLGVPLELVVDQLMTHGLAPRMPGDLGRDETEPVPILLDADGPIVNDLGPLAVIAPAGAGKTVGLLGRVARLIEEGVKPGAIAMLAFTRRSAEDLRNRLWTTGISGADRVEVYTHHGLAMELVRQWGGADGIDRTPVARGLESGDATVSACLAAALEALDDDGIVSPETLVALVSAARAAGVPPGLAAGWLTSAELRPGLPTMAPDRFAVAYGALDDALRRAGVVDFDGIIVWACQLLQTIPGMAAAAREQWPHLLVDEFQDANAATWQLIGLVGGDGRGVVGVADLCQSIYSFRQAGDPLDEFRRVYPGGTIKQMSGGHRCGPAIARVCGTLAGVVDQETAGLWEVRPAGQASPVDLVDCVDEHSMLAAVAVGIEDARLSGVGLARQAVLCQTNSQANDVADRLARVGVPVAHTGWPLSCSAVRDACCLLLGESADLVTSVERRRRLYSVPGRPELTGSPHDRLTQLLFVDGRVFRPLLADSSATAAIQRAALGRLYRAAEAYSSANPRGDDANCRQFVEGLLCSGSRTPVLSGRCEGALGLDAVAVLTIHSAKGLEFEAVHVPFLHRSGQSRPTYGEGSVEAARQECALLYVAASRAAEHLRLYRSATVGSTPVEVQGGLRHLRPLIADGVVSVVHSDVGGGEHWQGLDMQLLELSDLDSYEYCPRKYAYQATTPEIEWGNEHTSAARALREVAYACMDGGLADIKAAVSMARACMYTAMAAPGIELVAHVEDAAARIWTSPPPGRPREVVAVELGEETVRFAVDGLSHESDGTVIEAFVAGPLARAIDKPRVSMLLAAAHSMESDGRVVVRVRDLLSGEVRAARPTSRTRDHLDSYSAAVAGLRAGVLEPKRGNHCRGCVFRLECPDTGGSALAAGKLRPA